VSCGLRETLPLTWVLSIVEQVSWGTGKTGKGPAGALVVSLATVRAFQAG